MSGEGIVILLFVFLLFIAGMRAVMSLHSDQSTRIEKLEILACGFRQEEDGSISPRTNDTRRYNCVIRIKNG